MAIKMAKIKCLIVDDEAPARRVIEGFLNKVEEAEVVGMAKNAIDAYNILQKSNVDVMFLDINMPEITGIGLLKMLQVPPVVVMTTAYSEYGAESYDYDVADYLLKPIRFERFLKAFDKSRKIVLNQTLTTDSVFKDGNFEFKVDREQMSLPICSILYLQSLGNYLKIFTKEKKSYLTLLTTKEAEEMLKKSQFIRVHKSFIVNASAITEYTTEKIFIDGRELPVGKTYRKYFLEEMQLLRK